MGIRGVLWIGIIICVAAPAQADKLPAWAPAGSTLKTAWAKDVSPRHVWPEYPRPAMVRRQWQNLNGLWEYVLTPAAEVAEPATFDGKILVPFAVESALSGVAKPVGPDKALWYRRTFEVQWSQRDRRTLLHFGAVDWDTTVWVNGQRVGSHRGGYDPFTFDITDALKKKGPQQMVVRVWDPTDGNHATQPRGKQVLKPGGIFYTAVTGIWQTVWLEPVPRAYIDRIQVVPDVDGGKVSVTAQMVGAGDGCRVLVQVMDGMMPLVKRTVDAGQTATLPIPHPTLWSPQRPYLYSLRLTARDSKAGVTDAVSSYFGMRKISVASDAEGINRLFLNNKPVFQIGPLDQGWWPDGLYTAPTDEALRHDLEVTKSLGFNVLRKHVKVEPQRLYYWADRLGLMIWQDMPSSLFNRDQVDPNALAEADRQWDLELKAMMDALSCHPSIVMWVPFNEGWGQHDTRRIADWVKTTDPTRLVNNASGWTDAGVGDVCDIHVYPGPGQPKPERRRAAVLGEFGGLGLPVKGHLWSDEGNWGYRSFDDFEAFRIQYTDLITALYAANKGLAAAIYTQTTDCEVETNGLMTYDRAVCKLDPRTFASLNQGYLPPLVETDREGFIDSIRVELLSMDPYAKTYYTLDGTEPTRRSNVYSSPLVIDRDVTLKACNVRADGVASVPLIRQYRKAAAVLPSLEPKTLQPGLAFEFFEGQWSKLPDFSKLTPTATGVAKDLSLSCVPQATRHFGLRMTGALHVPKADVYAFAVNSDDGARLTIDGRQVVLHDGVHGMTEVKNEVALEAGWHQLELVYFQGEGGLGLQVSYVGPGISKRPIPAEELGH